MRHASKSIVFGVDALDKDLVLAWAQAGVLPTFRTLLEKGAWAITVAPPGLYVGAIWPSFSTGVSPARHPGVCHRTDLLQFTSRTIISEPCRRTAPGFRWEVAESNAR